MIFFLIICKCNEFIHSTFFRKQVDQQMWQGLNAHSNRLKNLPNRIDAHIWDMVVAPQGWDAQEWKPMQKVID